MTMPHDASPEPTLALSELIASDGTDLTLYWRVSTDPVVLQGFHDWYSPTGRGAEYFSSLSPDQALNAVALFEQELKEQSASTVVDAPPAVDAVTDATVEPGDTDDPASPPAEGDPTETAPEAGGETTPLDSDALAPDVPVTPTDPMPEPPAAQPDREQPILVEVGPGGDFYVAVDGDDNGTGTIDDPFASIERAISVAGAGDLILVRGGIYQGQVNIWNGGDPGAELQIRAYPGEEPVIDGSSTPMGTDLVVISASHVVFEGFEVMNSQKCGIVVWSSENVTIADNIVHSTQQGGIWIGSDQLDVSSGHQIVGNAVFNTGLSNQDLTASEGWPRAIGIDVSSDTIVRDNYVFENYGEGIGALSSTDIEITGNFVYDNYSVQIYLDNVQDVTATDNFVFHTFEEEFYRDGEPGIGILIANEYTEFELATTGLLIEGNTYVGVEAAFYDGSYGWGGGMTNSTIGDETITPSGGFQDDWLWA